jgi:hypothetical protein
MGVVPGGVVLVLAVALACATAGFKLDPQAPGDRCIDDCPDGLVCTGTLHQKLAPTVRPGRCELAPGRCDSDSDCGRAEQCVRTSERPGLCGPAPRI